MQLTYNGFTQGMVAFHKATEEPVIIMGAPVERPLSDEIMGEYKDAITSHVLVQRGVTAEHGGMEGYIYEYLPTAALETPESKATRNVELYEFMQALQTQAQTKKAAIDSTANVN
jgi:hypothetical protein